MNTAELRTEIVDAIQSREPMLITGAPGIGKTDIITQAAAEAGAELIVSHPVVSDPTDYKGLPGLVNDQAEFLPFGDLRKLMQATAPTVFFLDDIGQAAPSTQAALMQLLLAREINGHKISDQVTFLAATNRRQDRAGVTGILEPVKSRFTAGIVQLDVDPAGWTQWAIKAGQPIELIAFIRFRPELLHDHQPTADMVNSASPRTIAAAGRYFARGGRNFERLAGIAGQSFATEFLAFADVFSKLPNPDGVLMNPQSADVPTDPAVLYALCGSLARIVSDVTAGSLATYAARLPGEYQMVLWKDATAHHPEIMQTAAFIQWTASNTGQNFQTAAQLSA